jgi:hypothetical protein
MLSEFATGTRQAQRLSLRQEYEEFLLQRIEEFKEQLSRDELMAIADEAVKELEVGPEEQLLLTEVLVLEHVDRLIMRRLNLPSFRRWRARHLRLREAQRQPTHWNIPPQAPVATLGRSSVSGVALVVGGAASGVALYLAAHGWPVVFVDQDLGSVEAIETRAATESLSRDFQALVVALGGWFPDVKPALTILDARTLGRLDPEDRHGFLGTLKDRTPPGGIHCLRPPDEGSESPGIDLGKLAGDYEGWEVDTGTGGGADWLVARRP